MKKSKSLQHSKENLFELCLTSYISMKLLSLKLQMLQLFQARSSKTVKCRFTLKRQKWSFHVRKDVLRNFAKFTGKHMYQSLFFKKEALPQVFPCEFYKISNNAFFTEHLLTTASYAYVT